MKLVLVVLVVAAVLLQTAGAQNQGGASGVSRQMIGNEAVWTPSEGALERIRKKCDSFQGPALGQCFVAGMRDEGSGMDPVAFAGRMGNLAYMVKFFETGRIDVAYTGHPFRANENHGWFLVNGSPDLVDVDDAVHRARSGFEQDPRYVTLAKKYPRATLWPHDRTVHSVPMIKGLRGEGQRFIVSYRITDGCRACKYLGTGWFAFDFEKSGKFIGTTFLGIESAPRQSVSMTQADSVEEGFTNPKKPLDVKAGDQFTITLGANHTTGYRWQLAHGQDKSLVELIGSDYKVASNGRVGSGGTEAWTFLAKSPGRARVNFQYTRPWEKQAGPVKTTSFEIVIR